ncbi:MAG: carbohydrate ABC transporter permease [Lachnospiraceae bacterium]|nr:carbohydrate ABC transporter permease [Lachnospiraceae bacterium]
MIKSNKSRIGDWVFVFICVLVTLICLIPMLNLAARSFSSTEALIKHEVTIFPKGFNLVAYSYVFGNAKYVRSFFWTIFLTFVCTFVSLFMTAICAYPLIYHKLRGRALINVMITITMFFNAGIIPNYLLMKRLGLLNNALVLIIPSCLSVYNMIIMRSFFYGIPESLRESAEIDGASYLTILWKIYLPLSKPVFATLALFYAVGRWNGYSDALMYINNKREDLYPLQYYLYNILKSQSDLSAQEGFSTPGLNDTIKSAIVMFSTVPILVVYPFLQKYFIHGVTLGAVKE